MADKMNPVDGGDDLAMSFPSGSQAVGRVLHRAADALRLLLDAQAYAEDVGRSVWDFAVEIDSLRRTGCTDSEIRWLVCKGFVRQASESTAGTGETRAFRQSGTGPGLRFDVQTCFVLTPAGIQFASAALAGANASFDLANSAAGPEDHPLDPVPDAARPRWDPERQELRVGDRLVKQFKVPAANQERILAAFEEEGWPIRIDDPLPPATEQDPKRRLHDTINSLNRNQKCHGLRFLGDGTGQGVRWELAENSQSR